MRRDYEDPYALEQQLKSLEQHIALYPDDVDAIIERHELRDRLNFAWQDDEAETDGYDY